MTDEGSERISGILGNHVETERRLLEKPRARPGFRGTVELLSRAANVGQDELQQAADACASRAIRLDGQGATLDLGKCIMCGVCQEVAPHAFKVGSRSARPERKRDDLVVARLPEANQGEANRSIEEVGGELRRRVNQVLGRSVAVREVDAGSCNGCEVEVSALNNPVYDVERFGVHFVASPRHADVLLVTGVSTRNLELALRRTYEATPDPKVVVAVGACACSGGIFGDTYASGGGIGGTVPVDVFVPGCPPRPEAILYGIMLAVDRVKPVTP